MNLFIEQVLQNFCSSHPIFDESSIYVRFNEDLVNNGNDGFNSETVFGFVVYRTPAGEERISPPIMLKTLPSTRRFALKDSLLQNFFTEIFFHTRAAPFFQQLGNLRPLFPKFYESQIRQRDNVDNVLLIFENLRPRGFRTHKHHSFLDVDHLSLMLRKLGNFHAFSYRAKATDPRKFFALGKWFHSHLETASELDPHWLRNYAVRGLRRLRLDQRYSNRLAVVEKVVEHAEEFMARLNTAEQQEPLSVLCHGDFLRGNVLFRYENDQPVDLKMIDMAACKLASPVIDLSTLLYLNADQKTRDRYWDELIDSYYCGLWESFNGEGMPSKDCIMNEFRGKALYGYFIASFFLHFTMAQDKGAPEGYELLPEEYAGWNIEDIPAEVFRRVSQNAGGEEGMEALADVLRDIIDRGFVPS